MYIDWRTTCPPPLPMNHPPFLLLPLCIATACTIDVQGTRPFADGAFAKPTKYGVPGTGDAGRPDCDGPCPDEPPEEKLGQCGCRRTDDWDDDGWRNCVDACPFDAHKTLPGKCGCGIPDHDVNGDGIVDCESLCTLDRSPIVACECPKGVIPCDNLPPTVHFKAPDEACVSQQDLTVEVEAADHDGEIQYVSLYIDGRRLRDDYEEPYEWGTRGEKTDELEGLSAGKHRLEVVATDNQGATNALSRAITVVR